MNLDNNRVYCVLFNTAQDPQYLDTANLMLIGAYSSPEKAKEGIQKNIKLLEKSGIDASDSDYIIEDWIIDDPR